MHGLAAQEFADAGAQNGPPIAHAGVGRAASALELDFVPSSQLAQQMALPSPSWPAHTPNWWPLYTLASGVEPASTWLPVSACRASSLWCHPSGSPSSCATEWLVPTQWGDGKGVGRSSV